MIILQCVSDKKKLRIRFHCYIDEEGKTYMNVYNNDYNCQFPKDIRQEGLFYEIPDSNMSIVNDGKKTPFYKVSKYNIRILTADEAKVYDKSNAVDISNLKLYEISECVICFSEPSSVIFIPCAHLALCRSCYDGVKKCNNKCPLCRKYITNIIEHHKQDENVVA